MAEQAHQIISGAESEIHDEPHIVGSRITVLYIHERIENAGIDPLTLADRHNLDVAAIYSALAYYHEHPEEMTRVEREREDAIEDHRDQALTGPEDLD